MYALLVPVNKFVGKKREVYIDNRVFRLHTIITSGMLLLFAVLYCFKEFFGEPIYCLGPPKTSDETIRVVNYYCWTSSTYSVSEAFEIESYESVLYPGVSQLQPGHRTTFHRWYMWTPFFFLSLALLSYSPRYFWKFVENNRMKMLMEKLNRQIVEEEVKRTRLNLLTNYLMGTFGYNNTYAVTFFTCELLNFLVVIFSFYGTDIFLGYKFSTYGHDVVEHWKREGKNSKGLSVPSPMTINFPRLTKCEFSTYGVSGNRQPIDYLCVMTVNNCNDKIFLFLWFYFIVLACLSGLAVVFRLIIILSPIARKWILKHSLRRSKISMNHLSTLPVGDWFMLRQLSKNIDELAFVDLAEMLELKLDTNGKDLTV